jgi:hypothetical protein
VRILWHRGMTRLMTFGLLGMRGLPGAIDVEKFVEVHIQISTLSPSLMAFSGRLELSKSTLCKTPCKMQGANFICTFMRNHLFTAITSTNRTSSTQRAWQALPRHLRRRAASHDVRRVPLRLREKARAEVRVYCFTIFLLFS